jgi:hypothetical protein
MKTSLTCVASVLSLLLLISEQCQAQFSSSACSAAFDTGKHETATELICTAATADDDISVSIQYSCEVGDSNNNNATTSSLISMTSDVYCTGFKEQSDSTTTEWSCAAFADDTDFSELLADVEASSNLTCANGSAPMFYFINSGTESIVDECLERAASGTFINMEPYETFNETLALGLVSISFETVIAPCGSVSICNEAYRNLNVSAGAGSSLKCSDTTDGIAGIAETYIEFRCWTEEYGLPDEPNDNELAIVSSIASNVHCQSSPDLNDPDFTWECSALSEGTDFSRFLQEVEDSRSNITCIDGEPPVFMYNYCEKGGESCVTFPDCPHVCFLESSTDFNETLAYAMHSFYFNIPSKDDTSTKPPAETSAANSSQVSGFLVARRMMVIVATITAASFILSFL